MFKESSLEFNKEICPIMYLIVFPIMVVVDFSGRLRIKLWSLLLVEADCF